MALNELLKYIIDIRENIFCPICESHQINYGRLESETGGDITSVHVIINNTCKTCGFFFDVYIGQIAFKETGFIDLKYRESGYIQYDWIDDIPNNRSISVIDDGLYPEQESVYQDETQARREKFRAEQKTSYNRVFNGRKKS